MAQHAVQSTVLDDVRQGFATVAQMAQHVRINHDRIAGYAASLQPLAKDDVFDTKHHYIGTLEETASYVLTLDSINFGSGYGPYLVEEGWERVDNSLYYTIATRLKDYFETHGVLSAEQLLQISVDDCCRILGLNKNGFYSREMAFLCAQSLQSLGDVIVSNHQGRFLSFVEAASGSAQNMVALLSGMAHFDDVHSYRGLTIPFYKRAQITAADLHLAFRYLGQTLFRDISELTMFADNAVPHVLRLDGLLDYTDDLARKIDAGENIASGSEEEVELRACAGYVVEKIAAIKKMTAMDVDHILWHRGTDNPVYKKQPSHRTRSIFY